MDWISLINTVIQSLSILTVGGVIGSIIALRYRSKVEKAKADREEAQTDTVELDNTASLITLYKQAIDDLRKFSADSEQSYLTKIADYEKRLAENEMKLQSFQKDLDSKNTVISELTKTQLKMNLEMESLKRLTLEDCNECTFRENCNKLKAKKLQYESVNG